MHDSLSKNFWRLTHLSVWAARGVLVRSFMTLSGGVETIRSLPYDSSAYEIEAGLLQLADPQLG